jgi:hypothetical protein
MNPLRRLAALLAVALGLALVLPLAASAGTGQGLRPEHFTIAAVNDRPGLLVAQGPVRGIAADLEKTPTTAVEDFGRGTTVNVVHTDVNNTQPSRFDRRACKAFGFATGTWQFNGGTGRYRYAFGFGRFRFFLTLIFARHRDGRCVISPDTQPARVLVFVDATGQATAGRR